MRRCLVAPLGFVRRYSQASSGQQPHTTPLEYFSLIVKGKKTDPAIVTEELRKFVKTRTQSGHWKQAWIAGSGKSRSALVLLASKDMAKCLESHEFMSTFLETVAPAEESHRSATIDVLAGLTDGLQPNELGARQQSGLSVLYGPESILPRIWEQNGDADGRDVDRAASISVSAAYPDQPFNSHITIPMANTIFQNGRRSTLFATRYERSASSGRFEATLMQDKAHQDIEVVTDGGPRFTPQLPLIPLTPPREIVAGLGNIVRQVLVDGRPQPASKELEDLIPRFLAQRQKSHAVGVWAVVVPPHVVKRDNAFASIQPYSEHYENFESEKKMVEMNWECLSRIGKHGLRIHKILSGGGGWGVKQGLLSLDPETSYSAPEQEGIDDFIRAFEAQYEMKLDSNKALADQDQTTTTTSSSSSDIVSPGSYLIFCAQADVAGEDLDGVSTSESRGWNFGVAERHEDAWDRQVEEVVEEDAGPAVSAVPEAFTAMSAEGVYLNLGTPGEAKEHAAISTFPYTTKIDVPHAIISH
ncbi:hypothetical protein PFICI_01356 [Pestalotiopsis fici W106-1]|uniref:Uncharacterized protein n=1 Tax=Pestalotiopsis fici (strain W106-1 / CGMCC3.15140) TaxID=1229662 RepID=W3XN96_PESFW|nr:uncharacterized protein PFICI_01356 [Pestalotiopsis fici W106-1]ETS87528.1 hypothetical protein PFICI_01356 [Pestalotiopsis fici W106-1]